MAKGEHEKTENNVSEMYGAYLRGHIPYILSKNIGT